MRVGEPVVRNAARSELIIIGGEEKNRTEKPKWSKKDKYHVKHIFKYLVNTIYLTPKAVSKYIKMNPNEKIVVVGGCKARKFKEDKEVRSEVGQAVSRRSNLILTDKNLICGDWKIPIDSVSEAILMRVRSFFAKAYVLKIKVHEGAYYQFGLQYNPKWESQKSFDHTVVDSKIKLSPLSVTLRIFFIIWIIWYLMKNFGIINQIKKAKKQ